MIFTVVPAYPTEPIKPPTFVVFVKTFYTMFLRPKPKDLKFAHEKIPKVTVFSVAVLLIICLALGIFPNIVTDIFIPFAGGLI